MPSTIQKIQERVLRLKVELQDAETALRVAELVEGKDTDVLPAIIVSTQSTEVVKEEGQPSAREQVIKDITEFNGKISTDGLIRSYMKMSGITDRKIAAKRVYPVLTELKDQEKIEAYKKDPKSTGSLYRMKIKNPT